MRRDRGKRSLPLVEFVATAGREVEAFVETLWRQATQYRAAQTLVGISDYAAPKARAGLSLASGRAIPASMGSWPSST